MDIGRHSKESSNRDQYWRYVLYRWDGLPAVKAMELGIFFKSVKVVLRAASEWLWYVIRLRMHGVEPFTDA